MSKKTVIIGATNNPSRYAFFAAQRLSVNNHEIVPVGIKRGEVIEKPILDLRLKPEIQGVDTITLYLNPKNQEPWEDYIITLNPNRIIFNPGTENASLMEKAKAKGIETVEGCTLVMLSAGTY